jgi:hypothetical protein
VKALAPLALLALTGCVAIDTQGSPSVRDALACPAGETRREVVQFYFGRNIGEQVGVSEADFAQFLDAEVSPRFPGGFTVQDGQGRWRDKGVVYNEPSKVVSVMLEKPDERREVGEVARAYEARFRQDAVLTQVHAACVSFWLHDRP